MPATKSPGPANFSLKPLVGYKDHDYNSQKCRAPQWSVGLRPKTSMDYKSPGPAVYNTEKLTRYGKASSQASSMFQRSKDLKADANPGPKYDATEISIYKKRNPNYTARVRTKPLSIEQGPGPNISTAPIDVYKPRAPKFPMFLKLKDLSQDRRPGPNAYDSGDGKSKVLRQSPAYTHRWQTSDPLANKDKVPGPAQYDLMNYNPFEKYPAYSLRRRHSEYGNVPIVAMDNC